MNAPTRPAVSRRSFLAGSGAAAMITVLPVTAAHATPAMLDAAIREVTGSKNLNAGKVALDIPPLVENGNAVPMKVSVESPMSAQDHVKAIHVFNEKNPQPQVLNAYIGPRAGKAIVQAHIKLADSQRVVAIAELSDGTFWSASAEVIVTIAACTEEVT
jgi:sulfur-oxidizing protein SoxY